MTLYKRIVSLFLVIATLIVFVVPASAVGVDAVMNAASIGDWLITSAVEKGASLPSWWPYYYYTCNKCGKEVSVVQSRTGVITQCTCPACGVVPIANCTSHKTTLGAHSTAFPASAEDAFGGAGGSRSAYTDYVNTLPGSQYGKDGKFGLNYHTTGASLTHRNGGAADSTKYKVLYSPSVPFARFISFSGTFVECSPFLYWSIPIKTSGTYTFTIPAVSGAACSFQFSDNGYSWKNILDGATAVKTKDFFCDASFQFRFFVTIRSTSVSSDQYTVIDPCPGKVPTVRFKDAGMGTPPNVKPNTRTGSLAGDFGYYDKSGKLIPVKNIHIVNETDNSIYNPVTNTTTNFTDWNYDYSTRTYTLTIDNSTTQTITYGDEYVTINQGDTVTNIYYVTPPPPTPSTCTHSYAPTVTTPPTCTLPGVRTQTCPKCKDAYTEPIPATGHSWAVKTTVQTVYDATGALVTQGYTVYKCSTCGEEYKDTGGTGPPGGIGGKPTLPEGAVTKEGFFAKLWGILLSLLEGVVKISGAVLEGLLNIFGAGSQNSLDFYNKPSSFSGVSVWE